MDIVSEIHSDLDIDMPKKIRVGWLVGKDNDLVEDPKYAKLGNVSLYQDVPKKFRVNKETNEYLWPEEEVSAGEVHCDVAVPWYIHKKYSDIEIDIILPEEITMERMQANDVNFIIGYDLINCYFEGADRVKKIGNILKNCGNIWPTWEFQEHIYMKSKYMSACKKAKVPMAPTIYCKKSSRSAKKLLDEMVSRGWKEFVIKQSYSAFSLGFMKSRVARIENNPKILDKYFEENKHCPEFIVQEAIKGFKEHWETRGFWFDGEIQYIIGNFAAVVTKDGSEVITNDPPEEFKEAVLRIGKQAIDTLPVMRNRHGAAIKPLVVRTDIGCSSSKVHDKNFDWDPKEKTFFLNEIEYGGTNYFTRHLSFDCIPLWAEKYAQKAREIVNKKPTKAELEQSALSTASTAATKRRLPAKPKKVAKAGKNKENLSSQNKRLRAK